MRPALPETAYATLPRPPIARPAPTLIGDEPSESLEAPPPTLPPESLPAKAASGSKAALVGGIVALVAVAGLAAAAVLYATGVIVLGTAGGAHPVASSTPSAAPPARHFAHLTDKQIHARIEAAGQRIVDEHTNDPATVFVLAGMGRAVRMIRLGDAKAADATEQAYAKQGGATARDGNCVLHVELHSVAAAHILMEQIVR
jgi:hypothetical protein